MRRVVGAWRASEHSCAAEGVAEDSFQYRGWHDQCAEVRSPSCQNARFVGENGNEPMTRYVVVDRRTQEVVTIAEIIEQAIISRTEWKRRYVLYDDDPEVEIRIYEEP